MIDLIKKKWQKLRDVGESYLELMAAGRDTIEVEAQSIYLGISDVERQVLAKMSERNGFSYEASLNLYCQAVTRGYDTLKDRGITEATKGDISKDDLIFLSPWQTIEFLNQWKEEVDNALDK